METLEDSQVYMISPESTFLPSVEIRSLGNDEASLEKLASLNLIERTDNDEFGSYNLNLKEFERYISFQIMILEIDKGKPNKNSRLEMRKCLKEDFTKLNVTVDASFEYSLKRRYCPNISD